MEPLGVTWHALFLCGLTFTFYMLDPLEPLIDRISLKKMKIRKEDYEEMKAIDPNVMIFNLNIIYSLTEIDCDQDYDLVNPATSKVSKEKERNLGDIGCGKMRNKIALSFYNVGNESGVDSYSELGSSQSSYYGQNQRESNGYDGNIERYKYS